MRQQRHDRVVEQLPLLDELSWWRRRLVERHLRRCEQCAEEAARQRRVAEQLTDLRPSPELAPEPSAELLDKLLDQAADPGLRARAAVPARAAVSGARPGLSVALAVVVLGLAALAAYAGWRLADHLMSDD